MVAPAIAAVCVTQPVLILTSLCPCDVRCGVQSASVALNWPREMQHVKDSLSDLTISESLYMQYSAIAPEQQTVRELVCCRMYEMQERETRHRDALTVELQHVTQQLVRAESEMERGRMEKEQLSRSKRLYGRQHTQPSTTPTAISHTVAQAPALSCVC